MTIDGRDLGRGLLTHLECTNCGATYPSDRLMTTCPACAKVLFARYDLDAAASRMTPEALATRPWDFRRYAEILPIQEPESGAIARRGWHSAARGAPSRPRLWLRAPADQGRGSQPDRQLQGPRAGHGRRSRPGAGGDDGGHPLGRQRGRGHGRLRGAGRAASRRGDAERCPADDESGVPGLRRARPPRRRTDRRLRQGDPRPEPRPTAGATSRPCASRIAPRARRRWGWRSPSSLAGACPMP